MTQRAKVKFNGAKIRKAQREAAAKGLQKASEHLLQVAREQVPHEEGTLERSGVASVDKANLKAAVSFDGPYAVRQHEDLTYKHDEGRNAKYLEGPMTTERNTMLEMVATELRRSLR